MQRMILVAAPVSLWVSWAAFRGPPPPEGHPTPPPIKRAASEADRQNLVAVSRQLTTAIQNAKVQRGHEIKTSQLEGTDADGQPYIRMSVPDNPMMPNIASVATHCPPEKQQSAADWVYCPTTATIVPVIDGQSLIANE